jgi:hypothetical protein
MTRKRRVFKSSSFGPFSGAANTAPVFFPGSARPGWKKGVFALMLSSLPDEA